ncbi:hypothetical protein OAW20_02175 [Gammaproteobacteria bacterium]|nr:hypothetical protein [Gammaproteobacteria bacterium]
MSKYSIKNISPDQVQEVISKKISEQKEIINRTIGGKQFRVARISMPIDQVYYNLLNRRTNGNTKDYCKKNKLDSSHFSKENYFNIDIQQEYHSIIYEKHAIKEEENYAKKFINDTESQTEELLINNQGVLLNGNTRLSWWRENETFNDIEFFVFVEDYDLHDLLVAVNHVDSPHDIKQEYVWHTTVTQVNSWIGDSSPTQEEMNKYADDSNVTSKELQSLFDRYEIAKEFLETGKAGYEYFDDLEKIGVDHGGLTFKMIAEGVNRASDNKASQNIIEVFKTASWQAIVDRGVSTDFSDAYRTVEGIWAKENIIDAIQKERDENKGEIPSSGLLTDETNSGPDRKPKKKEPKPETDEDTYIRVTKRASIIKEIKKSKTQANAYSKRLIDYAQKIDTAVENFFDKETDLRKAEEAQVMLESSVKKSRIILDKARGKN